MYITYIQTVTSSIKKETFQSSENLHYYLQYCHCLKTLLKTKAYLSAEWQINTKTHKSGIDLWGLCLATSVMTKPVVF